MELGHAHTDLNRQMLKRRHKSHRAQVFKNLDEGQIHGIDVETTFYGKKSNTVEIWTIKTSDITLHIQSQRTPFTTTRQQVEICQRATDLDISVHFP